MDDSTPDDVFTGISDEEMPPAQQPWVVDPIQDHGEWSSFVCSSRSSDADGDATIDRSIEFVRAADGSLGMEIATHYQSTRDGVSFNKTTVRISTPITPQVIEQLQELFRRPPPTPPR